MGSRSSIWTGASDVHVHYLLAPSPSQPQPPNQPPGRPMRHETRDFRVFRLIGHAWALLAMSYCGLSPDSDRCCVISSKRLLPTEPCSPSTPRLTAFEATNPFSNVATALQSGVWIRSNAATALFGSTLQRSNAATGLSDSTLTHANAASEVCGRMWTFQPDRRHVSIIIMGVACT